MLPHGAHPSHNCVNAHGQTNALAEANSEAKNSSFALWCDLNNDGYRAIRKNSRLSHVSTIPMSLCVTRINSRPLWGSCLYHTNVSIMCTGFSM